MSAAISAVVNNTGRRGAASHSIITSLGDAHGVARQPPPPLSQNINGCGIAANGVDASTFSVN